MENKANSKYNIIFNGYCSNVVIQFERNTKIKYIIQEYFKRIKKQNLLIKNIDNIYFISNSKKLDDNKEMEEKMIIIIKLLEQLKKTCLQVFMKQ